MNDFLALGLIVLGLALLLVLAWVIWKITWIVIDTGIETIEDQWSSTTDTKRLIWLGFSWVVLRLLWLFGWALILGFTLITLLFMANDIKEKILDRE